MPRALLLLLCALTTSATTFRETLPPRSAAGSFVLAGEPIAFDEAFRPQFTDNQTRSAAAATRAGLVRWAATGEGQKLIARFNVHEFRIVIREDTSEGAAGRAPQPSLATLVGASDHDQVKSYDLILNPGYGAAQRFEPVPGWPSLPADLMAAAWADEMLHILYYYLGHSTP